MIGVVQICSGYRVWNFDTRLACTNEVHSSRRLAIHAAYAWWEEETGEAFVTCYERNDGPMPSQQELIKRRDAWREQRKRK